MPKLKSKSGIYMGIDPGKAGAVVIIGQNDILIEPMPSSLRDLWQIFEGRSLGFKALLEKVSSSPQMGVVSSFTFGRGYGNLEMALTASGIPYEEVTPIVWQRGLHVPPRKTKRGETPRQFKDRLRKKAQQLFPDLYIWDTWTKTDQLKVCDALLIAEYLRRREEGKL